MKLKTDKHEFLARLEYQVYDEIKRSFIQKKPDWYGQEVPLDLNEIIARAVTSGITRAMESLIEEQYTNEDFEKDMGLK